MGKVKDEQLFSLLRRFSPDLPAKPAARQQQYRKSIPHCMEPAFEIYSGTEKDSHDVGYI